MSELTRVNRNVTSQRTRARGDQVRNNAGGFVFELSLWDKVRRFLILGTEKGTYYVDAPALTRQNVSVIEQAVKVDARRLVDLIVEVSDNALAPKNSPALFALAVALTDAPDTDKAYVRQAVNKVARTGTHIFEFAQYVENLGGWGRSKRKAIAGWYEAKDADTLAYQAVKYRQRNGWTHRDLFRLAHPQGVDTIVGDFILGKTDHEDIGYDRNVLVSAFKEVQQAGTVEDVLSVLNRQKNLPWEALPTQFLKNADVWRTLFYNGMGATALIRNITRFAELGLFKDMVFSRDVANRLTDIEQLKKGRIHPVQFLIAGHVYENGKPNRSDGPYYYGSYGYNKNWENSSVITAALDDGFYAAFGAIEPSNKRTLLALDVSGSMSAPVAGLQNISAAKGAAAMAMVTARTEPYYEIRGFTSGSSGGVWSREAALTDMGISTKDNLNTVMRKTGNHNFGGTDCALPMVWAKQNKVKIDTFVVYTDNETWAGTIQPFQALKQYRQSMGIDARLVVVGMTSTGFTIADPTDAGMLDVVGFDASAPNVIANFSANR